MFGPHGSRPHHSLNHDQWSPTSEPRQRLKPRARSTSGANTTAHCRLWRAESSTLGTVAASSRRDSSNRPFTLFRAASGSWLFIFIFAIMIGVELPSQLPFIFFPILYNKFVCRYTQLDRHTSNQRNKAYHKLCPILDKQLFDRISNEWKETVPNR